MSVQVYLIPGFMGLRTLGGGSYFRRVPDMLTAALRERGIDDVTVYECPSLASGAIAQRARQLLVWMLERGAAEADSVHLVGHSSGGLDARLLAAPGVRLLDGEVEARVGGRVRSLISVSTPHHGTPVANLLLTLPFHRTLEKLGRFGATRPGQAVLLLTMQILELLAQLEEWLGREDSILDAAADRLLQHVARRTDDPTWEYLHELARDRGAAPDLTTDSMQLFNAAVRDRPETRYSSLITVAPPPRGPRARDLLAPIHGVAKLAFRVLYGMASRVVGEYPDAAVKPAALNLGDFSAPLSIDRHSNDGIVPCQSQAYGAVLDIVQGDHLDIVGQFRGSRDDHAEWLPSGARFGELEFKSAWSQIADELTASERAWDGRRGEVARGSTAKKRAGKKARRKRAA